MKLDIEVVRDNLDNSLITELKYFDSVTSTNELALDKEYNLVKEGMVIIAGEQTKGRGRLKRNWSSPQYQGLWMSIILLPGQEYKDKLSLLTLIGALSVHEAIKKSGINSTLKWPNDILYENKKVCGVLSQFKSIGDKINRVVVGIGVNVNQKEFDDKLKESSVSLRMIKNEKINKEKLLIEILDNFSIYYSLFKNHQFNKIIEKWKSEMDMLNKNITINSLDGKNYRGKVIDITQSGELKLKLDSGKNKTFIAGDVSIDKKSLKY